MSPRQKAEALLRRTGGAYNIAIGLARAKSVQDELFKMRETSCTECGGNKYNCGCTPDGLFGEIL